MAEKVFEIASSNPEAFIEWALREMETDNPMIYEMVTISRKNYEAAGDKGASILQFFACMVYCTIAEATPRKEIPVLSREVGEPVWSKVTGQTNPQLFREMIEEIRRENRGIIDMAGQCMHLAAKTLRISKEEAHHYAYAGLLVYYLLKKQEEANSASLN
ncbi:hypothetical protein KW784_01360 [Candidatus Parcubacteria bacterium]|nr:hypothetical protein [Candidatus Parcubacteria bacterium]